MYGRVGRVGKLISGLTSSNYTWDLIAQNIWSLLSLEKVQNGQPLRHSWDMRSGVGVTFSEILKSIVKLKQL